MRMRGRKSLYTGIGGNDMTIDEAIAHEREIVKDNKICNFENIVQYHKQLVEWLEELKEYKQKPEGWMWDEAECKGYNKAIDDFVNECDEQKVLETYYCVSMGEIRYIAERLKAGVRNGTVN